MLVLPKKVSSVEESGFSYAEGAAAAAAADIAAIDLNSGEVQEAKIRTAEPKMERIKTPVGEIGSHKAMNAKQSAAAIAKKQASDAAAKESRARMLEIQKAGKAKRAEEQAAAEAVAEAKAAADLAVLEEKAAAAEAAQQAKADYAAKMKEIEASGATIWEKNKAKKALKQIEELRASEAAKEAKEAEKLAKKEAAAARLSWTAPVVEAATPSDDELKQRKQKRRSWIKGESTTPVSVPKAEPTFDPDEKYHKAGKHMNTMARPVKGRKTIFDHKEEEAREHTANVMQRADTTASLYTEVLTWTFANEKAASEYLTLKKQIIEDDLQAEGYYKVYKIADEITADGAPGIGNGFMVGNVRYLTVAVGTCDQFIELHRTYDIRTLLNGKQTTQTKKQYGIQALEGWMVCQKTPTSVKDVTASWNSESWCNVAVIDSPFLAPGGWRSVAKYAKKEGQDLLLSISHVRAETKAALSQFMMKENQYVDAYSKCAEDIRATALYKGVKAPVSLVASTGESSAFIFRMIGAFQHVGTVEEMESPAEDAVHGLAARTWYFAGPGAFKNALIGQRVDFELEGTFGLTVACLEEAL